MKARDKKEILKRIEKLQSHISDELCEITDLIFQSADNLDDTYSAKSEKWQRSDKGENMVREIEHLKGLDRETTQILNDMYNMLDELSGEI